MSERARWYVVHTYSGYENKVKTDLEKTVKNQTGIMVNTDSITIYGICDKG